jgi:hypothetical protein
MGDYIAILEKEHHNVGRQEALLEVSQLLHAEHQALSQQVRQRCIELSEDPHHEGLVADDPHVSNLRTMLSVINALHDKIARK